MDTIIARLCVLRFPWLYLLDMEKEAKVETRFVLFWLMRRDQWRRALNEDGKFTVKDLASLVDEIWLQTDRLGEETKWNNLAPKKFNIFVWRVLKGRLPVLNKLDKRGIDLNTLLCPCCDDNVETIDHSLLLSNMTWSWVKFFEWRKAGNVDVFIL
ncbi:RNA-directed DNA polymerase, eukaryota, reverse transcriptase zinc-binding domain protein [Tanacetum coccineum]|uniref:RNA-directed DNA polymerase, eukaryota, reverse transcriptase zinc-binding domain protein n=1 Tax=Tanacetum coccineum TaxID=301880 RepID=A0ABQ5GG08_9ASTR